MHVQQIGSEPAQQRQEPRALTDVEVAAERHLDNLGRQRAIRYRAAARAEKHVVDTERLEAFDEIGLVEVNLTVTDIGGWTDMDTMYINVTDGIAPVIGPMENITLLFHSF